MSGTYIGTWHDGNNFTNESNEEVRAKLRTAATANRSAFAAQSGGGAGSSIASNGSNSVSSGGPGKAGVGEGATVGAGSHGVVVPPSAWVPGGSLVWGGHALQMKDADKVSVQPITIGGLDIQTDRGWSDGGDIEQRYGESELLSTGYGVALIAADAWKTWSLAGVPAVKGALNAGADAIGSAWGQYSKAAADSYRLPASTRFDPYGGTMPKFKTAY